MWPRKSFRRILWEKLPYVLLATPFAILAPIGQATWRVSFAQPTLAGQYTLTVGPDVADADGNLMNQSGVVPTGQENV